MERSNSMADDYNDSPRKAANKSSRNNGYDSKNSNYQNDNKNNKDSNKNIESMMKK